MYLNMDSYREVLLYLEENQKLGEVIPSPQLVNSVFERKTDIGTKEEIMYAIKQLCDADMLEYINFLKDSNGVQHYKIKDITPKGHEFLENIKDESNWKKTKELAKKAGSFAIDVLGQISINLLSEKIKGKI